MRGIKADLALAAATAALGVLLAGAGRIILDRQAPGALLTREPAFDDLLGMAASGAGLAVLAWWLSSFLLAFTGEFLARRGNGRAGTTLSAASPDFMKRLAVAVLGLNLIAVPAAHAQEPGPADAGGTAVAATVDPSWVAAPGQGPADRPFDPVPAAAAEASAAPPGTPAGAAPVPVPLTESPHGPPDPGGTGQPTPVPPLVAESPRPDPAPPEPSQPETSPPEAAQPEAPAAPPSPEQSPPTPPVPADPKPSAASAGEAPQAEPELAGTGNEATDPSWRPGPPVVPGSLLFPVPRPAADTADAAHGVSAAVQPGDSLWSLAARHLDPLAGDAEVAAAVQQWFEANRQVIGPDPDALYPGQILTVPHQTEYR